MSFARLRQTARELSMTASEKRRAAEDALLKATRSLQQAIEKQQDLTAAWRQWLDQNGLPEPPLADRGPGVPSRPG